MLEQLGFELHWATYIWMFSNKHTGKCFGDVQPFVKTFSFI